MNSSHEATSIVLQEATLGIIISDSQGKINFSNRAANKLFEYQQDELVGQYVETLVPNEFRKLHKQHRHSYADQPKNRPMGIGLSLEGVKKSGEKFPLEISLSHYSIQGESFVIAFISDISIRKYHETSIIEQKNKLEKLSTELNNLNKELEMKVQYRTRELNELILKLEDEIKVRKEIELKLQQSSDDLKEALTKEKELSLLKSQFVSLASHEFRTPLSTISSSASLISKYKDSEFEPQRNKHVERIKTNVTQLTDLLNEFLSLSKLEEGRVIINKEKTDIGNFCLEIIEEAEVLLKPNQKLVHTIEDIGKQIDIDRKVMKTIIFNLLSNAIKYTPENKSIFFNSRLTNNEWSIYVRDEGIGIPKEDQVYLFERFYRAKNAGNVQGTGLGLHIVKSYLKLLKGNISFNSELEKGTQFNINIPI